MDTQAPINLNVKHTGFGGVYLTVLSAKDCGIFRAYIGDMGIQVKSLLTNKKTKECR